MSKFEYKILYEAQLDKALEAFLNELGSEG